MGRGLWPGDEGVRRVAGRGDTLGVSDGEDVGKVCW